MTKLAELKAAFEAATPGEWWYAAANETEYECGVGDFPISVPTTKANAQFIALAHNAMPMLLEAVEALKSIKQALAGNPQVRVGNTTVHYAYMQANNALENLK